MERTDVEIVTFDEQERPSHSLAQPPDLWPEPMLDDRQVKIFDAFPLDQRIAGTVVSDWHSLDLDPHAEFQQRSSRGSYD